MSPDGENIVMTNLKSISKYEKRLIPAGLERVALEGDDLITVKMLTDNLNNCCKQNDRVTENCEYEAELKKPSEEELFHFFLERCKR